MAPLLTLYSQVLKPLRMLGTLSGVPGSLPPRSLPPASSMSMSKDAWYKTTGACRVTVRSHIESTTSADGTASTDGALRWADLCIQLA